ncbi:MAG TPA: glycerol-3-phosphate ABC transporter permease [Treponema sp.]|nr:glycerol-3-phosphate ABC transporter permease [Treponema sp.]
MSAIKKKFNPTPYFLLIPCMFIFAVFVFYPFSQTIIHSFSLTNARGVPVEWVGLENYIKLITSVRFRESLKLTLLFAPLVAIPTLLTAYFLAAMAHGKSDHPRASRLYETMFSLPMAIASAPAAAIWFMILSSGKSGILNHILGTDIRWLLDNRYALFSVALVTVWLNLGTSFIFLLTGFRNVPEEIIESARIDGAGYFKRLFRIVTPLASPQIFFVVFLNIITSFQAFAQIRLLTQGGPTYATNVLVYTIYQSAIRDSRFETAFAQSMVLFVIILILTILQFKAEKRTVHYQ